MNIVGEIDPEQLGRLGHRFNIDALDDSLDYRDRHDADRNKQDKGKDKGKSHN